MKNEAMKNGKNKERMIDHELNCYKNEKNKERKHWKNALNGSAALYTNPPDVFEFFLTVAWMVKCRIFSKVIHLISK